VSEQQDQDLAHLRQHVAALAEHFETVQIFATRHEQGRGTIHCAWGSGNYYARAGHVRAWLAKEDEGERDSVRAREEN
jgi:hypothetical protein